MGTGDGGRRRERTVGLFSRRSRPAPGAPSGRSERAAAERALDEWVTARRGVEVFVEPRTAVTGTTMLLVAHDGEFTRRPVRDAGAARAFARARSLPVYDAAIVGYPQRMRDYSRRQTILRKRAEREALEG
jgi:hypothetical protein